MIDIQKIFEELNQCDNFKKIKLENSPINVFLGCREKMLPSIAFMSSNPPILIESTQCIKVSQWEEKEKVYWSSFDLQASDARVIFYALCMDLINSTQGKKTDNDALLQVRNRYTIWRKMFKKASTPMSVESYQGLFGELYFLWKRLSKNIGLENAINAWSGSAKTAKDFSFEEEWYEVKTITTGATDVTISSLTQLEAENQGKLVIVRVERMSEQYDDGQSTVEQLVSLILNAINDYEIRDSFLEKITAYGYYAGMDVSAFPKYKVASINSYIVGVDFPRLTTKDINYDEITKVTYSLSLSGIKKYMEVENADN